MGTSENKGSNHYLPNMEDIYFNLFNVLKTDKEFKEQYPGMDQATYRDILGEFERFIHDKWQLSFQEADEYPLKLDENGEVQLSPGTLAALSDLRELGWDLLGMPEELGGVGVPKPVYWAVSELLVGANPAVAFYHNAALFARVLWQEGTPGQKELAKQFVENGWSGTMALTEPDAGSDVGAGTTKAVHIEDDWWALQGTKRFITAGEHNGGSNIIHLVLARREGGPEGTKGLSMFVVPKYLVNEDGSLGARNGVYCTRLEHKLGIRGSTTCELVFGGEVEARGWLIGGVHDGIRQMFEVIEGARMLIGVKAAATVSTAYLNAAQYAKERVQGKDLAYGREAGAQPITIEHHPDVKRRLINLKAHSEAMRALNLYTAYCNELGEDEPAWGERGELLLPMVKGYCSEQGFKLVSEALSVFGGVGYTTEFPMEQYLRDARIDTIYEGTTAIQGLDLFFRKIVRDQGNTLMRLSGDVAGDIARIDRKQFHSECQALQSGLDAVSNQVMTMIGWAIQSQTEPDELYKAGLTSTGLLRNLSEIVAGWRMLVNADVAQLMLETGGETLTDAEKEFYHAKLQTANWYLTQVLPMTTARSQQEQREDGRIMGWTV